MKILLIGEKGQLAWELIRTLMPIGEVVAVDFPTFDISNKNQVIDTVNTVLPDLVINASAYTDVDGAETHQTIAMAINSDGPGWLAKSCCEKKIPLIHYSTDFVFDGTKKTPYIETDRPNPINVYGLSKLRGEEAIQSESDSFLIFRLAWLYSSRSNNFVTKFLQWAKEKETLRIVDDQIGNPTWARYVAEATAAILAQSKGMTIPLYDWIRQRSGVYHMTCEGEASRYEWACKIWELMPNRDNLKLKEIIPVKSSEFTTAALRPLSSHLNCKKIKTHFQLNLLSWVECMKNNLEPRKLK